MNTDFFVPGDVPCSETLGILGTKSTISQKLEVSKFSQAYINPPREQYTFSRMKKMPFSNYFNHLSIFQKIEIGKFLFHLYIFHVNIATFKGHYFFCLLLVIFW